MLALAEEGHEVQKPEDLVKDPYVLEFTGLPEAARVYIAFIEQALGVDITLVGTGAERESVVSLR